MAKKQPRPKDVTRVTIRFRDEVVAEEFHRQASEAGMRPSPFAAELIERALTQADADDFEQATFHRERDELRDLLKSLQGLPRDIAENNTDNDDVLSKLAALQNEVAELKETLTSSAERSDEPRELLRELKQLRADVTQLAAMPHVFRKLREDVATAIRPLLVRSCGLSHDEAEDWIRRNVLEE